MNPWIILAVVVAIAGAGGGGFLYGGHVQKAEDIAEQKKAVDAAIAEHNKDTVIDMQAAYERGQQEAKVRVITRTIQGEANAITASAPIPVTCRLDDNRMRLLGRAINVANGDADTPAGLPVVVPQVKPASKP